MFAVVAGMNHHAEQSMCRDGRFPKASEWRMILALPRRWRARQLPEGLEPSMPLVFMLRDPFVTRVPRVDMAKIIRVPCFKPDFGFSSSAQLHTVLLRPSVFQGQVTDQLHASCRYYLDTLSFLQMPLPQ